MIAQYYNLIHLGFIGYRDIMENALQNARLLSKALEATGWYTCVSDIHRQKGEFTFKGVQEAVFGKENETSADYNAGLPVVAFRFSNDFKKDYPHVHQESISTLMRVKQYIIPSKVPKHPISLVRANQGLQTTPFPQRRTRQKSCESWSVRACRWTCWID